MQKEQKIIYGGAIDQGRPEGLRLGTLIPKRMFNPRLKVERRRRFFRKQINNEAHTKNNARA
jgi:hypothetical protein